MKRYHIVGRFFILGIGLLGAGSCKKYLDASPSKNLITITAVSDLQGLMDNYSYMNILCSEAGEDAADNYFLSDQNFQALPTQGARAAYLWEPGVFDYQPTTDWQNLYTVVYNANVVLDNIGGIQRTSLNANDWDNCKGQALAFRGKSFLEIAAIWSKAYDSTAAGTTLGIPLRLTSDFNTPTTRATMAQTYSQILSDLNAALPLLPNTPVFVYRPSKSSVYGLLARTYLTMGDYAKARLYADSSLQINSTLVDFNTIDTTAAFTFNQLVYTNPEEDMLTTTTFGNENLVFIYMRVDTNLYAAYAPRDLRRSVFYTAAGDGYFYFRGSYQGNPINFNGLAADEMYLTRAEGEARAGDATDAMADVNTLLIKRWATGTFVPLTAGTADSALSIVLAERRKELVFRSLRWTDIKRLNHEGAGITITRIIEGQTYTLSPNDPRYAEPIPTAVIQQTGIQQN